MPNHSHSSLAGFQSMDEQRSLADQRPDAVAAQFNAAAGARPFERFGLRARLYPQTQTPFEDVGPSQIAVPTGMFDAFVKTCQRWRLARPEQWTLLGYKNQQFLGDQLLLGYMPPRTQDVRDRIGYILAISLGLGTLFNEQIQPELDWLTTEHRLLQATPLDFMLRGRMVNLFTVADIVSRERAL
jgi:hypothetical protein